MDDDPRAALIYESAVRTLDQQASLLANVQTRAGTLLTATSIVTVTLAGLAIAEDEPLSGYAWVAAAFFLLVVAVCVWEIGPANGWKFRIDAHEYVQHVLDPEPRPSLDQVHRDLSLQMNSWASENEKKLNRRLNGFRLASLALVVEVGFWIGELVRGGEL
jgi:hypothetical protein